MYLANPRIGPWSPPVSEEKVTCPKCDGKGHWIMPADKYHLESKHPCPYCEGAGHILAKNALLLSSHVAQLGGAPDDLHNLIRVVFADMSIDRINEVCKQVVSMRKAG